MKRFFTLISMYAMIAAVIYFAIKKPNMAGTYNFFSSPQTNQVTTNNNNNSRDKNILKDNVFQVRSQKEINLNAIKELDELNYEWIKKNLYYDNFENEITNQINLIENKMLVKCDRQKIINNNKKYLWNDLKNYNEYSNKFNKTNSSKITRVLKNKIQRILISYISLKWTKKTNNKSFDFLLFSLSGLTDFSKPLVNLNAHNMGNILQTSENGKPSLVLSFNMLRKKYINEYAPQDFHYKIKYSKPICK